MDPLRVPQLDRSGYVGNEKADDDREADADNERTTSAVGDVVRPLTAIGAGMSRTAASAPAAIVAL